MRQLNFEGKQVVSPETEKARGKMRTLRDQTRTQKVARNLGKSLVRAYTAFEHSKESGVVKRIMESPFVNPARGDTNVYPKGSKALAEKEKWMRRIQRLESTGLTFMPGELVGLPDLPLPNFMLSAAEAAKEAHGAVSLRADALASRREDFEQRTQRAHDLPFEAFVHPGLEPL